MAGFYASKETLDLAGGPSLAQPTARRSQLLEAGAKVHGVGEALDLNLKMTLNCLRAAAAIRCRRHIQLDTVRKLKLVNPRLAPRRSGDHP